MVRSVVRVHPELSGLPAAGLGNWTASAATSPAAQTVPLELLPESEVRGPRLAVRIRDPGVPPLAVVPGGAGGHDTAPVVDVDACDAASGRVRDPEEVVHRARGALEVEPEGGRLREAAGLRQPDLAGHRCQDPRGAAERDRVVAVHVYVVVEPPQP